ncbi:MAG: AMIN domain-containing protein [Gemmatimonadetes bacterium]|nr:AMIN domain-containing protein [Gemmatimonadota bacterium]
MIPVIALSLAALSGPGAGVTDLSVRPTANRTEIVIGVEGVVRASHFALAGPNRIVVDLIGLEPVKPSQYRISRGGVQRVRIAQFDADIVRVVIDMDQAVDYELQESEGAITLSFENPAGDFEPWSSSQPGQRLAAPPPATPAPQPAANTTARQQGQIITVMFTEEPVANVLAAFADFANRSIVPSADVKAKMITAEVRNQPWEIALEAIMAANNLVPREMENGVIVVEDGARLANRPNEEPLQSRQYEIVYVSADSLVQAVRAMLTPQKGQVSSNKSSNTLLVTDVPSVLDRIEPLIQQLDVRMPQVNIAATIAFVDRSTLEQLGVTYDVKDSRGSQLNSRVTGFVDENGDGLFSSDEATREDVILLGGNSIAALGNANFPVPNPALQVVTSLVLGRHTLISFLEALQSITLSDIQAKPVVTVMNHRQAEIQVGQRTPVRVIDAGALGGGAGQAPTATVDYQDTGVILRVTPHVTGDQVLLDIHAERSDAVPASSDIGFVFTTQNARTQVLVRDGETTVIGGLTITEKSRVRTGIPILMDLPVLGSLFRNTREAENKRDLLIMVTPHIVRN